MLSSKSASGITRSSKPPTSISASAIIAETASLAGTYPINIGDNTVIHPRAKLTSSHAPVIIGKSCIISERCLVGHTSATPETGLKNGEDQSAVQLENGVVVEVGAKIEARLVGEGTHIGVNSRVGKGAIIGKHCKIGPTCQVQMGETLPDGTVLFGNGQRRIDHAGILAREVEQRGKHIDVLRTLIPNNLAKWRSA